MMGAVRDAELGVGGIVVVVGWMNGLGDDGGVEGG